MVRALIGLLVVRPASVAIATAMAVADVSIVTPALHRVPSPSRTLRPPGTSKASSDVIGCY